MPFGNTPEKPANVNCPQNTQNDAEKLPLRCSGGAGHRKLRQRPSFCVILRVLRAVHSGLGPWSNLLPCVHESFVFELGVVTKVDQQSHYEARGVEVIQQLGPVLIG